MGATFNLAGFSFQLALGRPSKHPLLFRRPAGVELRRYGADAPKRLIFGWPQRPASGYVSFNRAGQYDGPRPQDVNLRRT